MSYGVLLRAVLGVLGVVAMFSGWAGVMLGIILVDTVFFSAWEIVLLALCFDLLWSPLFSLQSLPWYVLLSLALIWAAEPVRRELLA